MNVMNKFHSPPVTSLLQKSWNVWTSGLVFPGLFPPDSLLVFTFWHVHHPHRH